MPLRKDSTTPVADRRRRIIRAADVLVRRGGLQAVTIRSIATATGVPPMSIYRHFVNRDAIIEALIQAALTRFETRYLTPALSRRTPFARIEAVGDAYLDFALAEPRRFELLFLTSRPSDDPFLEDYERNPSASFVVLRRAITDAITHGASPLHLAVDFWAHAHGLIALYVAGRFGTGEAEFRRFYSASMKRLLGGMLGQTAAPAVAPTAD